RQRAGQDGRDADPQQEDARQHDLGREQDEAQHHPAPGAEFGKQVQEHGRVLAKKGQACSGPVAGGRRDERAAAWPSCPNTSLAMAPMPPSEPISDEASIGKSTILLLLDEPILASASVYFCATK